MPGLAERVHDPVLDGSPARAADRDAHLVVAAQAEQLPVLLARVRVQLNPDNDKGAFISTSTSS